MSNEVTLKYDNTEIRLPLVLGSENERGIDIQALRAKTGLITLDPGYGNTASCESAITFIDGEKGILRYRGIPTDMFTVMFAIGRLPGWIAHWWEQCQDQDARIARPRQIYTGDNETLYIPIDQRG